MKFSAALLLSLLVLVAAVHAQEEPAAAEAEATAVEGAEPAAAVEEAAAATADGVETKSTAAEEGGCSGKCPSVSTQHYKAKGCEPVMDLEVDPCCPARYECISEEARNIPITSCLYGGVVYEVGQDIPVVGPCRRGCQCKKSLDPEEPAKIECAVVECQSAIEGGLKPGCRGLYSNDECCEVELECSDIITEDEVVNANISIRSGDCFAEGLEYFLGDKIFFVNAPCEQCICTPEFSGSDGPGCVTIDCGLEYRDRHYLREGCTPLYLNGTCCPTDWICPGSPKLIYDESKVATEKVDATKSCSLGEVTAPRGDFLRMYDCHVSCQCVTPPDFTCVQYTSCPLAVAAQNAIESP